MNSEDNDKKLKTPDPEDAHWVCDECRESEGDTSHCLRPEHCHASIQANVDKADSMLDDMRERGLI